MRKKFRVVVDTNIFIRSWFDDYKYCDDIINLIETKKIKLLFSQETVGELVYISKKYAIKNMSSRIPRLALLNKVMELFLESDSVNTTDVICPSINDKYDEMFLKCAIKSNAEYLISDDFKSGMHKINIDTIIVSAEEFVNLYNELKEQAVNE